MKRVNQPSETTLPVKKKQRTFRRALALLALLIFGALVGYYAGKVGFSAAKGASITSVIALAVLFIPTFMLVIGTHEAGHALAGIWVNFDFRMFVVGPFMWEKEQMGWRFKWNRNVNTAGGMVICLPMDTEQLRKRFSIYAAGGPVASLALSALAYGVFRLISMTDVAGQVVLQTFALFLAIMALLSATIFIATAIPLHLGGFSSDGARVLRLRRGGETARLELLILKILTNSTSGLRPKLLDLRELNEAKALAEKLNAPFEVYLCGYLHHAAFDQGDLIQAEQHLLEYVNEADRIPEGIRNVVWLDAAFFYAFAKSDLHQAATYWNQYKPTAMIPKAQVYATEAAIGFLKDEREMVLSKIAASLRELPNMIDQGVGVALREKLLRLQEKVAAEIKDDARAQES